MTLRDSENFYGMYVGMINESSAAANNIKTGDDCWQRSFVVFITKLTGIILLAEVFEIVVNRAWTL